MNLTEILDMGKYAFYVWGSYGVVAGFMLIEVVLLTMKKRSLIQSIARLTRLNRE